MLLLAAVAGCSGGDGPATAPPDSDPSPAALEGCGPVAYDEVRGRPPSYGPDELARFANDHAMCVALWAPGVDRGLVPQGMTVSGSDVYVSGFDGSRPVGRRYCSVERLDLDSGALLARLDPVGGSVGGRPPVHCRHGGGLVLDGHGLWLAETTRLWLLDPDTLAVRRGWALEAPVTGSFALHDDAGRLGLGRFSESGPGRVDWFDPDLLLAPGTVTVTTAGATSSVPAPGHAQGAVWADLDGRGAGLWFVRSHSACGVLVGPRGQRRGFIPGGESMSLDDRGRLWVASESGSRRYQRDERPMTPQVAGFDVADLRRWARPGCRV